MKSMLAAIYVLLFILHGARSLETGLVAEDLSPNKQPSFALGRKLRAVAADDSRALMPTTNVANKGTCTIADRLDQGFARMGDAFRQMTTYDAAECALYCEFIAARCVAINYRHSDRACFFIADPGYIHLSLGYTTALVKPSVSSVCDSANIIVGYDKLGENIPGNPHKVSSATECCMLCLATPGCVSYSAVAVHSSCWLRKTVGPADINHWVVTGVVCLE